MNRLAFENTRAIRELQGNRGIGPNLLEWQSNSYPFIPGSSSLGKMLGAGGFSPDVDEVFIVAIADLPATLPAAMQSLTANGSSYKIVSTDPAADGSHLVISCKDKNAGA